MQTDMKNPFPVMINIEGRPPIAADHVISIETHALDSHKTILVHTSLGSFMLHDQVAFDMAVAFGLRPAAVAPEAPLANPTPAQKRGKTK